jgi:hypothetical protein
MFVSKKNRPVIKLLAIPNVTRAEPAIRGFRETLQVSPRLGASVILRGELFEVGSDDRVDRGLMLGGICADLVEHLVVHREGDVFHDLPHSFTGYV